jgi:ABC-2 type transport system permease protein
MKSLMLLYTDELKGFYKSKVMLALWFGLPALAVALHAWSPQLEGEFPLSRFTALIVSSLSGTLASAMLAVSIIHEKSRNVYQLFLIRPLERREILLAKFFAVYTGLAIAGSLAIGVGLTVDYVRGGQIPNALLIDTLESLALTLSMTAIASAVGILIGIVSSSVLLGVILVIYGGNQIIGVVMLPLMINFAGRSLLTILSGGLIAGVLLYVALLLFNRTQF